jgi:hypothetical protein
MSIKEAGFEFVSKVHNELVKIRADQLELGQDLTERINGVANNLKRLDAKCEKRFDAMDRRLDSVDRRFDAVDQRFDAIEQMVEGRLHGLEDTQKGMVTMQTDMMQMLLAIQRKLDVN